MGCKPIEVAARWAATGFLMTPVVVVATTFVAPAQSAHAATTTPRAVTCKHASGSTSKVVTLTSCRQTEPPGGKAVLGSGSVPGRLFIPGKAAVGVIHWTSGSHTYSTTVSTTTKPYAPTDWCPKHGYKNEDAISGKVTSSTDPDISVGQSVYGDVCISSSGVVVQSHYGFVTV